MSKIVGEEGENRNSGGNRGFSPSQCHSVIASFTDDIVVHLIRGGRSSVERWDIVPDERAVIDTAGNLLYLDGDGSVTDFLPSRCIDRVHLHDVIGCPFCQDGERP